MAIGRQWSLPLVELFIPSIRYFQNTLIDEDGFDPRLNIKHKLTAFDTVYAGAEVFLSTIH